MVAQVEHQTWRVAVMPEWRVVQVPAEQETVAHRLRVMLAQKEDAEGRRITQEEIAAALGAAQNQVSNWKRGRDLPSRKFLRRIADYFGVDYNELVLLHASDEERRGEQAVAPVQPLRTNPALMLIPPDIDNENDPRFQAVYSALDKFLKRLDP